MNRRPKWLGGPLGVVIVSSALTLVMAAPVLRDPATRLFGTEIVGRHHDPFTVISFFERPTYPNLYTQPATDYLGAAIAGLGAGGVRAYNFVVLASFPLAALFAYLLTLQVSGSPPAAWLAGLFYAFSPFHVAHAAYHPHVAQTQWLPLYLLALWLCLEGVSGFRLLLLTLATVLVALSNFYYGLVAAALTPVALAGYWLAVLRGEPERSRRSVAITGLALLLLAALGLWYVASVAPQVINSRDALAFARRDLFRFSARWWSYFVPPAEHPFLGGLARGVWLRQGIGDAMLEQQLTLGIGLLLLSGAALVAWLRADRDPLLRPLPMLVLVGVAAFLFSLSPELQVDGIHLLRPSGLLYAVLPMFRAYARFGVALILVVAMLAGLGAAVLLRRSRRATLAASALVILSALELAPSPPWRWRDVLPTSGHRWLAEQPPPVRVLDCAPASSAAERSVYSLFDHQITLLGPSEDCGEPEMPQRLSALGFTHMIIRRASAEGRWLSQHTAMPGLREVGAFDDARLFVIDTPVPPLYLEFSRGFHLREYDGTGTYRWMTERGELALTNTTSRVLSPTLELAVHSFPQDRVLDIDLDGRPVAAIVSPTEPAPFELGPLVVSPGRHTLTIRSRSSAVIADKILHNGDPRALTIAVWRWRWLLENL